jgi:hypothetical protein
MGFNLHVKFTGLVTFVKNADETAYPPMCAVLVDARESRRALDGTILKRHRPFVRYPSREVVGATRNRGESENQGIWYIDRQRIYFEVFEDAPPLTLPTLTQQVKVFPDGHPEKPDFNERENKESLSWLFDLKRLFPDFEVDPRVLAPQPDQEAMVAAQVVIDRGILGTGLFTDAVWEMDRVLSGAPYRQVLSHEVKLVYENLREARMVAVSLDDPTAVRYLDLTGLPLNGEEAVEIFVVNACDDNPLQWEVPLTPTADVDSKWYFELLSTAARGKLSRSLGKHELPHPKPVEGFDGSGGPGAQGSHNCIPAQSGATSYAQPMITNVARLAQVLTAEKTR